FFEYYMLLQSCVLCVFFVACFGSKFYKPDCTLPALYIPEINCIAFEESMCPRIPDTIMMIMIGGLNSCQNLSVRSIKRVNKATSFIICILSGWRINGFELISE